jgi:1-deoxy-D-xylulose-5-phosphate reductoisomerase
MKNIIILGSTGSIGDSSLSVVKESKDKFNIVALSAKSNYKKLAKQAKEFKPKALCIVDDFKNDLESLLDYKPKIYVGKDGLINLIKENRACLLLNAIVGFSGFLPTLEAINQKMDIALANKEALVVGGNLIMEAIKKNNVKIIPVDSEHNAIFQCLKGHAKREISKIILTASGGPFLNLPMEDFSKISIEDALSHPNWSMGKKISVDSATMVNKCLELIEAKWLFDVDWKKLDVVIHPQSIVHGMVEFEDKSTILSMSKTSMKVPISYALFYPNYSNSLSVDFLNITEGLNLNFIKPDIKRYPVLALIKDVLKNLGTYPCAFNGANEECVESFLNKKIKFNDIFKFIEIAVKEHKNIKNPSIDDLIECNTLTREKIKKLIEGGSV